MDFLALDINPVENYKAPELPMFGENNAKLVKKLPTRWQKNKKIIAGLGLLGVFALSGCVYPGAYGYENGGYSGSTNYPPEYIYSGTVNSTRYNSIIHNLEYTRGSYQGYSEDDLLVRIHTGGGGGSSYMVHLTEHEAFGIIRTRLEAAGLRFETPPPTDTEIMIPDIQVGDSFNSEAEWFIRENMNRIQLDLFDEQKDVGVSFVNWLGAGRSFMPSEQDIAKHIVELFATHRNDIAVGAFFSPGQSVWSGEEESSDGWWRPISPTDEAVEETRPVLVRQLINQADMFIARLQLEGVLDPPQDINVIINEAPLYIGDFPILVNNQIMVPAQELFTTLGMNVSVNETEWQISTIGTLNGLEVWVQVGLREWRNASITVRRDDVREWLADVPVFVHDNVIYAPLQFVADLIGANIEWDEATRTLTICN